MSRLKKQQSSWDYNLEATPAYEEIVFNGDDPYVQVGNTRGASTSNDPYVQVGNTRGIKEVGQKLIDVGLKTGTDLLDKYKVEQKNGKLIVTETVLPVTAVQPKQLITGVDNSKLFIYAGGALLAWMLWRK